MKKLLVLALCFLLLLSGCKAQTPPDDEVASTITDEQNAPADEQENTDGQNDELLKEEESPQEDGDNMPTEDEIVELCGSDAENYPINERVYVTYVGDDFVVLKSYLDGVKFKFYTDYEYARVYDACDFVGDLVQLKEPEQIDGDETVTHLVKFVNEAEFTFDPNDIETDTKILYLGEDHFLIQYKRRGMKVYVDDVCDYRQNDFAIVKGSATPLEETYTYTYLGEDIEVCYEIRDAEITVEEQPTNVVTGAKPVIYLYPEEDTKVSVSVNLDGELTCVYPEYDGAWEVTARPDGTLYDENGREYYCLYWEGEFNETLVENKDVGFVVKGSDTAEFLREKLLYLGLNEREANEFIIYWLPQMEDNNYNYIYFSGTEYTQSAKLDIAPNPDTLIRIMMAWEPLEAPREVTEQKLQKAPERRGFTAVEWGGARIR